MNVGREWNMRNGFSGRFEFLIACRENIKAWLEINWKSLLNASSALNTTGDRQRRNETRSWIFHCLLSNFTRFLSIKRHQTLKQEVAQEVADLTNNINKLSLKDELIIVPVLNCNLNLYIDIFNICATQKIILKQRLRVRNVHERCGERFRGHCHRWLIQL